MIKVPETASSLFNSLSLAILGELSPGSLRNIVAETVRSDPSVAQTHGILEANVEQYA